MSPQLGISTARMAVREAAPSRARESIRSRSVAEERRSSALGLGRLAEDQGDLPGEVAAGVLPGEFLVHEDGMRRSAAYFFQGLQVLDGFGQRIGQPGSVEKDRPEVDAAHPAGTTGYGDARSVQAGGVRSLRRDSEGGCLAGVMSRVVGNNCVDNFFRHTHS